MSEHSVEVVAEFGELNFRFVCNAPAGSPCRRRPADPDVEEWDDTYPGEIIMDGECWAVEWVSNLGWEAIRPEHDGTYVSIPVAISYEARDAYRRSKTAK